jgi:SAM-dependent methyltransferase
VAVPPAKLACNGPYGIVLGNSNTESRHALLLKRVDGIVKRFYPPEYDPYRHFEREVASRLKSGDTLVDAGCGRSAPVLSLFGSIAAKAIGTDTVRFDPSLHGLILFNSNLTEIPLRADSADLVICRSVLEHLETPISVYKEVHRILKPGGKFIFITPNIWSYPIVAARIIPNRLHASIVHFAEGRPEDDTFRTCYRSNSFRAIRKLAVLSGFEVESLRYLSMLPHYLLFHPLAFRIGVAYERAITRIHMLRRLQHWILGVLTKGGE